MKNFAKFLLFVLLVSAAISFLYDYRLKHGMRAVGGRTTEKYTLAPEANIDPKQVASLEALNEERRALVKSVVPSVVAIKTSKTVGIRRYGGNPFDFFFGNQGQLSRPRDEALVQNSLGSGVVVTNEGHIITNNHVVDQVDQIEVQLSDGRTKKARLIGADAQIDLAVLKIDNPDVKPLKLADSDTVQVGDFVVAIGNPFGFEETVTDGIISSKGRPNRADVFSDLLQTNAAINPGNSGGPLINLRGEVVGINTAIISASGSSSGVGFAIPSNTVRTALESLLKQGRIIRGYLGVFSNATRAGQTDGDANGVIVSAVAPGSPAAQAQLQAGDVIKKFDGRDVKNFTTLRTLVAQAGIDKKVELDIERNGRPLKVQAEIKEQPVDYQTSSRQPQSSPPQPVAPEEPGEQDQNNNPLAPIHVGDLTAELATQFDLPKNVHGVVVTDVDADSGLAEVQKGDVIEEVNQQPVGSVADYNKILGSLDPTQPSVLFVCRHRARSFVVVRPR